MLALRLKPEIENRLTTLALKTGRTKTLEQQLDEMEDYYLAEEAYKEWVAGGSKTVSLEEVKKHCSL